MIEPSKDWPPDERIQVAVAITKEMRDSQKSLVFASDVHNWGCRIDLVLTQSAAFLEQNRKAILQGQVSA